MPGAAIACEIALASEIGASFLKQGGSAADAIIAANLVVDTINSYHSGIGGGGFALARAPDGSYASLDFRVAAPNAAEPSLFTAPGSTLYGGLSVAVPGQLRGLDAMHKRWGKLPWKALFEPSIKIAEEGFPASADLINILKVRTIPEGKTEAESWIHDWPELAQVFAPGGKFVKEGDLVKRPTWAATLRKIAEGGAEVFYRGELAEGMVEAVQKHGGVMTLEDLKAYKVIERTPVSTVYKGSKVTSVPAPASGACLILALNILSNFHEPKGPNTVEDAHRMTEALKLIYGRRTELGDPDFVDGVAEIEADLTSPETAKKYAALITEDSTHPAEYYTPNKTTAKEDFGTSHFCVADSDGLVISMTTTITYWWGSRIMVPSSGIVLNDGMEDFSSAGNVWGYELAAANFIHPGKRTLSSQSPFIIEHPDGSFWHAGGAAGGSKIISSNVQQARNVLDYGMSTVEALNHSRIHNQLTPNVVLVEDRNPPEVAEGLKALGHTVSLVEVMANVGCGISCDKDGEWSAAGEPRLKVSGGVVVKC